MAQWLLQNWQMLLEIGIICLVIMVVVGILEGTRGAGILRGLLILCFVFTVILFIVDRLDLYVINALMTGLLDLFAIALVVIFQPEIRRVFSRIGQNPLMRFIIKSESQTVMAEVIRALEILGKQKIGALIALERDIGLKAYIEQGTPLEAEVTAELLSTIFYEGTPLHDGAVIIKDNRIAAAGCLFPLTENPDVAKGLGTRHRAALGITEESDAVTLVVSQERGEISLASRGKIWRGLDRPKLQSLLKELYLERTPVPAEAPGEDRPEEVTKMVDQP